MESLFALVNIYCHNIVIQILGQKSSMFSTDTVVFNPPNPIGKFFYRCDRKFFLDDLVKLYDLHEDYGIVLISGKRCEFYLHNKTNTKLLKAFDECLPNAHKAGGSSSARFGRIHDEKVARYAKKIAEYMLQYYITDNQLICKGIIVAGPAEMKQLVSNTDLFIQHFKKHLLATLTISEITDQSIYQVIKMADSVIKVSDIDIINTFGQLLHNSDLIVFGHRQTLDAFYLGHLDKILVSNNYVDKKSIIGTETKTHIHIINSPEFIAKYGELVGIRFYANEYIDTDNMIGTDVDIDIMVDTDGYVDADIMVNTDNCV